MPENDRAKQSALVARILALLTVATVLISGSIPVFIVVTAFLGLSAVTAYVVTALLHLRFSLRTLLLVMLWAGASATLLTKLDHPALFALGILGVLLLVAFLISSVVRANIPHEKLDA
jgi:hypothetical protein